MSYVLFKSSIRNPFQSSSVPIALISWVICNFVDPSVTRKKLAAYCDRSSISSFLFKSFMHVHFQNWHLTGDRALLWCLFFLDLLLCLIFIQNYLVLSRIGRENNLLWLRDFISGIGRCCGPGFYFFSQDSFLWRDMICSFVSSSLSEPSRRRRTERTCL